MEFSERLSVSLIIPVLDGAGTLPEFFAALSMQDMSVGEIIVGDSESDDSSVEICRNNGARVISIPRGQFDHGGTRTLLAKEAKGNILVFCTQDAIMGSTTSLRNLIQPLQKDASLCCSYGRQLPAPDATLLAAHLRHFDYPEQSEKRTFADRSRLGLKTVFISNSFAAYKKDRLAAAGYFKNGLIFGEDTCTLGRLIEAGETVYYAAEATVYHSHNYNLTEEFKRSFDIGVLHSSEEWLLQTYGKAEGVGKVYVRSAFDRIIAKRKYTILLDWLLRSAAKFTGYKLGRNYKNMSEQLCAKLSMNRRWWSV